MLQISGGSMSYAERLLFEGLEWLITPRDRIGLVGSNGSGKSTLLKILAGMERLNQGQLSRQKGLRIGYLPQDGLSLSGRTVFAECLSVFDEALALEREQQELAEKMSELDPSGAEYDSVARRYQWTADRYHALDGYTKEAQVGSVLAGLGFPKTDWSRPTEQFSGGWQMRVALAKLLLGKPNLLLLDEPTNHLDLEARNWLEAYLNQYPYAFLVVSHDRYFLDTTVEKIVEIWNQKVASYAGNYSKYEQLKQQRLEQIRAAYRNQQERIRHLESFINRFRYKASKAAQVQSRVKELEKIERIELSEEEKAIHFKFPQPRASGRVVMEFQEVAKSYGPKQVFKNVSFILERGDRIGLVGPNGAGKSTLLRMLSGGEPLAAGTRRLGHKVEIEYFAQDQYKALDATAGLFDDFASLLPQATDKQLRGLLGCFLFSRDDVFKPIGVLSGGERNRYALARLLIRPGNLLLLDEPTNHLDLRAKDVLLRALLDFTGTVVFVAHDRYFIDRLATKIFAVGNGEVRIYPGNYEDYLWRVQRDGGLPGNESPSSLSRSLEDSLKLAQQGKGVSPAPRRSKRMNPIQAERLRHQVSDVEDEIGRLEAEIEHLQELLAKSFKDHQECAKILDQMEQRRKKLQVCERRWEQLSETLESQA